MKTMEKILLFAEKHNMQVFRLTHQPYMVISERMDRDIKPFRKRFYRIFYNYNGTFEIGKYVSESIKEDFRNEFRELEEVSLDDLFVVANAMRSIH